MFFTVQNYFERDDTLRTMKVWYTRKMFEHCPKMVVQDPCTNVSDPNTFSELIVSLRRELQRQLTWHLLGSSVLKSQGLHEPFPKTEIRTTWKSVVGLEVSAKGCPERAPQ